MSIIIGPPGPSPSSTDPLTGSSPRGSAQVPDSRSRPWGSPSSWPLPTDRHCRPPRRHSLPQRSNARRRRAGYSARPEGWRPSQPQEGLIMLRANVGVSKKMSKDYNSQGFTLNLEGEILATPDDPETVIERIRELYSIAEEALDRQISDNQSIDAMARRDADDQPGSNGRTNSHQANGPN